MPLVGPNLKQRARQTRVPPPGLVTALTNAHLSELLALEASKAEGTLKKAFARASRSAFLWPEEARDLVQAGRSLTEFPSVGPFLERQIRTWLTEKVAAPDPPEIRSNFMTMANARAIITKFPDWASQTRGDFHMHTLWSDGSATVEQMQSAAEARGYEYIAISDHTKGLKIAHGIDEEALAKQAEEIDQANSKESSVLVLKNCELNLSTDGTGDIEPSTLRKMDLVLGSFHSALRTTEDQTNRYLAALSNPCLNILGHPRGRIYNFRDGLKADWHRVMAKAAEKNVALEIDAYPDRQDLDLTLLQIAREEGTRISFGSDAHHPWQLLFLDLAIAAALLAQIPSNRVVNFMSAAEVREWARAKR